jgi:hypothetical protein
MCREALEREYSSFEEPWHISVSKVVEPGKLDAFDHIGL